MKEIREVREAARPYNLWRLSHLVFFAFFLIAIVFFFKVHSIAEYQQANKTLSALMATNPEIKSVPVETPTAATAFGFNIPTFALALAAMGTLSTFFFSWRSEVRNNKETNLKIEKLEQEVCILKTESGRYIYRDGSLTSVD